jgi:hypothetical protein
MALKVVDAILLETLPVEITDYRLIVGDPATGKYYKKLPGSSGASGAQVITVDADFSLDMAVYDVLEYICFKNVDPLTVNIGTTNGGSEILQVDITDSQPVVLMHTSDTAAPIFFSGILSNTIVKFKIS